LQVDLVTEIPSIGEPREPEPVRERLQQIAALTKARLATLVVLTTVVGFLMATTGTVAWATLLSTALGTGLAALGANGFNQYLERSRDALMERTRNRPLPSGTMAPWEALAISGAFSVTGIAALAWTANLLTAGLALLIHLLYLGVYTPLKLRSPVNTLVGGVCGAIPPVMGWTAVRGSIGPGAWILFLILFIWQMPHFLSLAWLYREDYARGGYRMLPVIDRSGTLTCKLVVLHSFALIPLGMAAALAGIAGWAFLLGAIPLGLVLLVLAFRLHEDRNDLNARRVFFASLVYLPLLLGLMVADRGPAYTPPNGSLLSSFPTPGGAGAPAGAFPGEAGGPTPRALETP
jgi:protoheme IX farnesyltransferase